MKKAQFSVVAVGDTRRSVWDNKVRNPIFHPLVALKYFLRDGQNTLFPRTLYLGGTGDHGLRDLDYDVLDDDNDYNERVENLEIVNARKEHFDSKVHQVLQSLLGDTLEANQWSMLISSQDPDAAAALLITILPNLQTLNIYVPWTGHLTQQLKKIHLSSAAASCNRSPPLHSFSSLSELYIQGDSQEDLTVFDMLATSMLIPSLRRLKGRSIKASDQSWPHKEGCSGVTEISLDSCAIDSNSLSECLRAVRSLQLFDYTFDIGQIYPPTYLEPRGIVAALRKYASTTLVHLGLNMEAPRAYQNFDNGEPFLDSLRSFEKLETIRLDSVMLFKEVEVSIASSGTCISNPTVAIYLPTFEGSLNMPLRCTMIATLCLVIAPTLRYYCPSPRSIGSYMSYHYSTNTKKPC